MGPSTLLLLVSFAAAEDIPKFEFKRSQAVQTVSAVPPAGAGGAAGAPAGGGLWDAATRWLRSGVETAVTLVDFARSGDVFNRKVAVDFYTKLAAEQRQQAGRAGGGPQRYRHLAASYGAWILKDVSESVGDRPDGVEDPGLKFVGLDPVRQVNDAIAYACDFPLTPNPHEYLQTTRRRELFDPIWAEAVEFAKDKDGEIDHGRALSRAHSVMTGGRNDAPDAYAPDEAWVEHFITAAEQGYRYGATQAAMASFTWEAYSNPKKMVTGKGYGVTPGFAAWGEQLKADMLGLDWGSSLPGLRTKRDGITDILFLGTYHDYTAAVNTEYGQWSVLKGAKDPAKRKKQCDEDKTLRLLCWRKGWSDLPPGK